MSCPEGLYFNDRLDVCDWPESSGCIQMDSIRSESAINTVTNDPGSQKMADQAMRRLEKEGTVANRVMEELDKLHQSSNTSVTLEFSSQKKSGHETYDGHTTTDGNGNIHCDIYSGEAYVVFEELSHAFQLSNQTHTTNGNYEMEAKAMAYKYHLQTNIKLPVSPWPYKIIYEYTTQGTSTKSDAVRALQQLGYSGNDFDESTFHMKNYNQVK